MITNKKHEQEVFLTLDLFCTSDLYTVLEQLLRGDIPRVVPDHMFFKTPGYLKLFTGHNWRACAGDFLNSLEIARFEEEDGDLDRLQIRITIRSVIFNISLLALFIDWLNPNLVEYENTRYCGYIRKTCDAWPWLIHKEVNKDCQGDNRSKFMLTTTYKTGAAIQYELRDMGRGSQHIHVSRNECRLVVPDSLVRGGVYGDPAEAIRPGYGLHSFRGSPSSE